MSVHLIRTSTFLFLILLFAGCASFDRSNILPGQRIEGLGFTFMAPTEKPWFAVVWGNSNRIKISQLNDKDSFSIVAALNKGPRRGMFRSAEAHLEVVKRHRASKKVIRGFTTLDHKEWVDSRYGELCVRYSSLGKDARGRFNKSAATVELVGLTCEHQEIDNVFINFEISRRSDADAPKVDLAAYADELFSSVKYQSID